MTRSVQQRINAVTWIRLIPRRLAYAVWLQAAYAHFVFTKRRKRSPTSGSICGDYTEMADAWYVRLKNLSGVLRVFRLPLNRGEIEDRAERVRNHQFSILGQDYLPGARRSWKSGKSTYVPWLYDPTSGYTWCKYVWYRHARRQLPGGVDVKLPWELSRCQHFVLLGEAYDLSKDEKYAREYRDQILDWIDSNPVGCGPNWACTMEVGIRIANWVVGLLYFWRSPVIDREFLGKLLRAIDAHGRHIMRNLERISPITSNHYMGNVAGLYFLSALTPVLPASRKWKEFAKRELEKEILRQSYEDGWNFESSTAYHRLVTEMLLYSFLLGTYLGERFSGSFVARLRQMVVVLSQCKKPDGRIPQIGDNDNGRFLVFNVDEASQALGVEYLIATAGRDPRTRVEVAGAQSAAYPVSGRFLFRSPSVYFIVTAGPKGQAGLGGHAHNDVLSYELNVLGRDVIVDPGCYSYTPWPKERNRFRSVAMHSTLYWPGLEPCSLSHGLFELPEEGTIHLEGCCLDGTEEHFAAVYSYKGRFHRREISFDRANERITCRDFCSHEGALLTFVCAPGSTPVVTRDSFQVGVTLFELEGCDAIEIERSGYSPSYGMLIPNMIIRVVMSGTESVHTISIGDK